MKIFEPPFQCIVSCTWDTFSRLCFKCDFEGHSVQLSKTPPATQIAACKVRTSNFGPLILVSTTKRYLTQSIMSLVALCAFTCKLTYNSGTAGRRIN